MNFLFTLLLSALTITLCLMIINTQVSDAAPYKVFTSDWGSLTTLSDDLEPELNHQRIKRDVNDAKRKKFFWLTFYHENLKPLLRVLGDLWKIKIKEHTTALTELLQQEVVIQLQQLGYFTDAQRTPLPPPPPPGGPGPY